VVGVGVGRSGSEAWVVMQVRGERIIPIGADFNSCGQLHNPLTWCVIMASVKS
jgi:hypothetical protein